MRRSIDLLELDDVAVVGHDSGGMIARHAVTGDRRLRALALIDTEQSTGISWRFKSFLAGRRIPGFGAALGWLAGQPRLRRNRLVLGDAFADRSLLDGEFDEFFLQPLHNSAEHRHAAMRLLRSFDYQLVRTRALHRRIDVPVALVWGEQDKFFPVDWARTMVADFPQATLHVIPKAGLFAHEERPTDVATSPAPHPHRRTLTQRAIEPQPAIELLDGLAQPQRSRTPPWVRSPSGDGHPPPGAPDAVVEHVETAPSRQSGECSPGRAQA